MAYFKYTYTHVVDGETTESVIGTIRTETLTHAKHELARRYNLRAKFETKVVEDYGELQIAIADLETPKGKRTRMLVVSAEPLIDLSEIALLTPETETSSRAIAELQETAFKAERERREVGGFASPRGQKRTP